MRAGFGEEHGRLSRGVSTADDDDLLARAKLCLHRGGAIVDPGALEVGQTREVRFAILRAGRDDDGARRDPLTTVNLDRIRTPLARQLRGAFRDEKVGAELLRLCEGARRELLTGDAVRKAEIVLDARTGNGLAPCGGGFDDERVESF